MIEYTLPVLADLEDIIVPLVIVIIAVIGSIMKSIKESMESKQKNKRPQRGIKGEAEKAIASQRARELAEQRRRKLQELARRREAGSTSEKPARPRREPLPSGQSEESDYDRQMAERRERAEAERMRRAREMAANQRREELRELAQRRAAAQREQRDQELVRQTRLREQLARREAERSDRMTPLPTQPGHDIETVHRHVADAKRTGVKHSHSSHAGWARKLAGASPRSLQRAIILTEVLGTPVGMRDLDGQIGASR